MLNSVTAEKLLDSMDIRLGSFDDDYFHQEPDMENKEDATIAPAKRKINIYKPANSGTELHRAIRSGVESKIEALLNVYVQDFEKVKNYLVSRYQWNPKDKIWLRKTILVATGIEQCHLVKELSRNSMSTENLDQAVIILLSHPIDGESVAVIHPSETNQLKVFRVLRTLLPNGFLSWNHTALENEQETFVETAASCGRIDIISRLLDLGAELAPPNHNPLMAACQHNRTETVYWLLNEHFDDFDCTMRDLTQKNAFIVSMQKNELEVLDFVLNKMITYRQKYFGESETDAFSSIFLYENEQWSSFSSLTYAMTEPVVEKVGEYVAQYKFDLSYQWKDLTILSQLLERKTALEYCYAEIRKNPKLLEMIVYDEVTIVHECIRCGALDILKEMYELHPDIRKTFETDHAFDQLHRELWNGQHEAVRFILDNHKAFFEENFDKLKDEVIFCEWLEASFYEKNADLLSEYFPEVKRDLEEAKMRIADYYPSYDFKQAFKNCKIKFGESAIELEDPQRSLSSIRGINGVTLLHYAVNESDQKLFINLLEAGCDFNALDNEGNHPIHYVKHVEMFDYLIGNHPGGQSLVHRKNSAGLTVLHKVCSIREAQKAVEDLVERIIECGADVNQLTNDGELVVHKTVSVNILKILLKHNVNLEVVSIQGETAFHHHLTCKNAAMSNYLFPLVHKLPSFKEHADKCLEPFLDSSHEFFSCSYQHLLEENPETTRLIFDSVYNHSRQEASRLFNTACNSSHNFIAERFLEFGYDLDFNYRDESGYTTIVGLFSYMEEDNLHIVKQLLQKGVDLEIPNQWGTNALLALACRFPTAKWYGRKELAMQLLLDHGAKINASDNAGNTALHLAFTNNDYILVEFLLANGADLTVKNNAGRIPVEMRSTVNREIFCFLK